MAFWQLRPRGALQAFVQTLWASRREALSHRLEWLLPSGCADLVIPLHDDAVLRARATGQIERLRCGVFQGASDAALLRATGGAADVVGVHFRPGGASALLSGAAVEDCGRSVALADFPGDWAALRERLLAEPSPPRRLMLLEATLSERTATAAPPDPLVAEVLQVMRAASGTVRIDDLRALTGLGPTRFISRFQASVGLTPKRYARVLRFNRALMLLSAQKAPALAEIALSTGYADQAHFANEFRRLAGLPPSQYRPASPEEFRHLPERKNLQDRPSVRP